VTALCNGTIEPPLTVTSLPGDIAARAGTELVIAAAAGDGGATAGACWPCAAAVGPAGGGEPVRVSMILS
jgi:hypothetical protein